MKIYVAYGSNLNKEQMFKRCPGAIYIGSCEIKGYSLVFKRCADIIKSKGKCPAALWLITKENEDKLDRYEGVSSGLYKKIKVTVNYGKQTIEGLAYQMTSLYLNEQKPTDYYYEVCRQGYIDFGLDLKYLEKTFKKVKDKY
jgi:gamma-glutamylcyclotransferase (GGCT)/AIG2-like uncharacterized protein YtfP